jgi:hypothetical protein
LRQSLLVNGQIWLPKLDSRYPTPVPRPTGTTLANDLIRMRVNLVCRKTICRFRSRPAANREAMNSPTISHHTSNSSGWVIAIHN